MFGFFDEFESQQDIEEPHERRNTPEIDPMWLPYNLS